MARFHPSVRTAGEMADDGAAWGSAGAIESPLPTAAHPTAAHSTAAHSTAA
ncbi:MAG TPA: hypothetical protein VHT75_04690 [Acidimicrobiales bacterium]|nr:hypothetical protein [Acidimicrobiales bacterium]